MPTLNYMPTAYPYSLPTPTHCTLLGVQVGTTRHAQELRQAEVTPEAATSQSWVRAALSRKAIAAQYFGAHVTKAATQVPHVRQKLVADATAPPDTKSGSSSDDGFAESDFENLICDGDEPIFLLRGVVSSKQ